jgi:hypothetical protein
MSSISSVAINRHIKAAVNYVSIHSGTVWEDILELVSW